MVLALTDLGRRHVWVPGPIPCPMIIGYPRSPGLTNPELIREIVRAERASPCSPPPIHHELLRFRERLRRLSASFSSNLPRAARQRPQFRVIDHRERHVIDDHASHQRMIVLPAALAHRGSSNSFAPPSIYGPRPRARVEVQARFGTRLQSYIRPAYRASDEALGLDGFPRASFDYQSGDLARPCLATEFGSAGPTGSPSASHNAPYATSARAVFKCPHQSLAHTQFCAPRSLNRGWRAGAQNCMRGYPGRAVTITSGEQRPQYSRILVGQSRPRPR